jgi:hypothetical protein
MIWIRTSSKRTLERWLTYDVSPHFVELISTTDRSMLRVHLPLSASSALRILRGACRVLGLTPPSLDDEVWLNEGK